MGKYTRTARTEQLLEDRAYMRTLVEAGEEAVKAAKTFAPVDTGAYRNGIKVVIRGKKVYVSATDWKSHWMEWGSINNSPSAPVRRGVRAVGLPLHESEGRR